MLRQMLVWLVSPHRLIRNSRLSLIIQQKVEINMIKVKKQINMTGLVMSGGGKNAFKLNFCLRLIPSLQDARPKEIKDTN